MLKKFRIRVNGKEYIVEMEDLNPEVQFQVSGGQNQNTAANVTSHTSTVPQNSPQAEEQTKNTPASNPTGSGEPSTAPMPGTILDIFVKVGDRVTENEPVLVLEAMKMENKIVAPKAGTVTSLLVQKGQAVDVGTVLFTVE